VLKAMNGAAQAGDLEKAHALYRRFLALMVFEQQPGVAVRKELYRQRGLIASNAVRHPANAVAPALATALTAELARSLPGIDVKQPLPPELFA
jgi:4-hydroxy-tetrahydrodipicolinate synthase